MTKILLQIFPFLLIFFFPIVLAQLNNSSYPNCPSYNCNDVTISYPFWRSDTKSTSQFCGYEGFGINCSAINGTELPNINLAGALYHVQDINHNTSVISLVDYDVSNIIHVPNDCPRVRHAIDLGTLPLSFSASNVNISFHFNCTGYPNFSNAIPCLDSGTGRKASFNVMDPETENFDWSGYSCEEEVVTTVLREAIHVAGSDGIDYVSGLRRGFELNWSAVEDCRKCEESKGRCGRNYNTTELMCFCSDGTNHCYSFKGWNINVVIAVGAPILLFGLILIICCITYVLMVKLITYIASSLKRNCEDDTSVEAFIRQYGSLSTKRYKYSDIKKMTNSFQVQLGGGGFGTVFHGKLPDGRLVAVKVLNSSRATGKEFINEVASIGRTSHVNIVSLLGFCSNNNKRALVYEFMPNGSLEKFIPSHDTDHTDKSSIQLEGKKLYEVALGVAQGLNYLHRGCNPRILHLDIKPANILLDQDFCPKIADFGLAKLYPRNESIVSLLDARGTIGYIAPEVFNRNIGGVSHKSDVYSYGMLILEMVGRNRNVDVAVGSKSTSDSYFPYWIYNRLEKEENECDDLSSVEENDYIRKMTIVGLWCIQTVPSQRPTIDEVIEMLEGSTGELKVPQKPSFSYPVQAPVDTCSISGSEHKSSDLNISYKL